MEKIDDNELQNLKSSNKKGDKNREEINEDDLDLNGDEPQDSHEHFNKNNEEDPNEKRRLEIEEVRNLRKELIDLKEKEDKFQKDILSLADSCKISKNQILNRSQEIDFKEKLFEDLTRKFYSINNKNGEEENEFIQEIKEKLITSEIEKLLNSKAPILNWNEETLMLNSSQYQNLLFNVVQISYKDEENGNKNEIVSEKRVKFYISQETTISQIKEQACINFKLADPNKYILMNYAEGIINKENMRVNSYLEQYSIFNNNLKLVNINTIKAASGISEKQKEAIKEANVKANDRKAEKLVIGQNIDFDRNKFIMKEFFREYPLLGLYKTKIYSNEFTETDKNYKIEFKESNNIKTSFIYLLLNFLYWLFTLILIYNVFSLTKFEITERLIENKFNISEIYSLDKFKDYMVNTVGINVYKNESFEMPDQYYSPCNDDFCFRKFFNNYIATSFEITKYINSTDYFDFSSYETYIKNKNIYFTFNIISDLNMFILGVKKVDCKENGFTKSYSKDFFNGVTCYADRYNKNNALDRIDFLDPPNWFPSNITYDDISLGFSIEKDVSADFDMTGLVYSFKNNEK